MCRYANVRMSLFIIFFGLIFIGFVGRCVYMVLCISVYDEIQKKGGSDSDNSRVKELFETFKKDILLRLKNDQQVELKPEFFNF
jgi:hypothetical protein